MARVILVEATPWDATTGAAVPVRLAGGGKRHYTWKGAVDWLGGVVAPPKVTTALGFADGRFTGGAIPSASAIGFMPSRPATVAQLAGRMWNGAAITISSGDDDAEAPAFTVDLAGTVAGYSYAGGVFAFTMSDLAGGLAKPLVTATFAGTGGIEGIAEAAGRVKRRSWGRCWNLEGRLLDKANAIYEFGDPARPLEAFDTVKDKGRDGPLVVVGWAGSIAATLAALVATTAPSGGAAVAPSIACAKWWTTPAGPLTADLRGEVGDTYVETVAAIASRVSVAAGGPALGNLAALVAARPDPAGVHVDTDGETAAAVLDRLMLPASLAWGINPAGSLDATPIAFADPVETVIAASIEREAAFAPVTEIAIGYRRNHKQHGDAEISAAILAADVVDAAGVSILDAIAAARALAAGKSTTFFQVTAPSAAESAINDLWVNEADGNRTYKRVANATRLFIGGFALLIGGQALALAGWVPAPDAGIGQALEDAAGAQSTADGKIASFNQDDEPVATALGDLWYQPTAGVLLRWDGAGWASTADATALNQHGVTPIADCHVNASYTGATSAGQLPQFRFVQHLLGSIDVSVLAAVTAAGSSGVIITVNNTPGDPQRGLITIVDQPLPAISTITGTSTQAGVEVPFSFQLLRHDAAVPATPNSPASGGGPSSAASANVANAPGDSSTPVELARCAAVMTGSGASVAVSCPLTYYSASEGALQDEEFLVGASLEARTEYSIDGGATWLMSGVPVTGDPAYAWFRVSYPKGPQDSPASLTIDVTISGLASAASVIVRLLGASANGGTVATVEGTLVAVPA